MADVLRLQRHRVAEAERLRFESEGRRMEAEQRVVNLERQAEAFRGTLAALTAKIKPETEKKLESERKVEELSHMLVQERANSLFLAQQKERLLKREARDRAADMEEELRNTKRKLQADIDAASLRLKEEHGARITAERRVSELTERVKTAEDLHRAGKVLFSSVKKRLEEEAEKLREENKGLRAERKE